MFFQNFYTAQPNAPTIGLQEASAGQERSYMNSTTCHLFVSGAYLAACCGTVPQEGRTAGVRRSTTRLSEGACPASCGA